MRPIPKTATGEHCGDHDIFDRPLLGDLSEVGVEVLSTMIPERQREEELSGLSVVQVFQGNALGVIIVTAPTT